MFACAYYRIYSKYGTEKHENNVVLVSSDKRWMVGLFIGCGWGLGTFWHLLSVYVFRDWRYAMILQGGLQK